MAYDAHKNFAISTVATAPSPATSGTSLVVASGHGTRFPTAPFNAVIWPAGAQPTPANAEVVRVTVVSTDTLTITRAQESSSARTVIVGDQIAVAATAKVFTDIETEVAGRGTFHGVEAIGAVTFNDSTHVLSIASITYWFQGARYSTASATTCDIDDTLTLAANTLYFFYFDAAAGALKVSASAWNLKTTVPVATVFWNGSAGAIIQEWHNHTRDLDWHIWAHETVGARYESGMTLTKPTTTDDALLQIETGTFHDEDLEFTTGQQTTCRVLYKVSANVFTWVNSSLPYAGTSGQPQYLDTDTYTLTNVNSNNYVCMWVYATPDTGRPIHIIPTHAATDYGTIAAARAEQPPTLSGANLGPEKKLIYKFIYKGDGNFQESVDYRSSTVLPSGGTASTTAGAVSFTPSGGIAATTVQTALEEVDSEKVAGPASATDNAITRYDATTGKLVQNSSATVDDNGTINIPTGQTYNINGSAHTHSSYLTDVVNDTTPQLGGDLDLNDKVIQLKESPGSDHLASGIIGTFTAAESLVLGDVCYFNSAGKMAKADSDAASTMPCMAMALETCSANDTGKKFLLHGFLRDDTYNWATVGAPLYVSGTAGTITDTRPSAAGKQVQIIGWATNADRIWFNPSPVVVEVA